MYSLTYKKLNKISVTIENPPIKRWVLFYKREVISDSAFNEFKKKGVIDIAISGITHAPVLNDIKQRLEKPPLLKE